MSKTKHPRFFIDRTQFAMLESALSVALPAAKLLGFNAGIFWLRGSIFAATPRASIGLANTKVRVQPDWKTEKSLGCIAVSQLVAKKVLFELKTKRARYLEKIGFAFTREDIFIDHDPNSRRRFFLLRSQLSWLPCMTPFECYESLTANRPCFECVLGTKETRSKLKGNKSYGYVALREFTNIVPSVSVGRSPLLAFLESAKEEDTMFRLAYYDERRCITCRAGEVIAVLDAI